MTGRETPLLSLLGLGLVGIALISATTGAYRIDPWQLPQILWSQTEGFAVLLHIRFPRVVMAGLVGAVLGLTGATLQGLFRNPLADPGLSGISAGAGLGAALWIVLGGTALLGLWGIPFAAFLMGGGVTWCLWLLAKTEGTISTVTLLLAGIAVNSLAGAGIGIMTFLADDQQLRSLTFWLLGSLTGGTWEMIGIAIPFMLIGAGLLARLAPALNALSLGESEAYHLGVSTEIIKKRVILGSALAVGAAVSVSGGIGFIGLVVPHLIRLMGSPDHRLVLPGSALGGALLLIAADLLARTIVSPAEMPVGTITALMGTPFFLWLLWRFKRELSHA